MSFAGAVIVPALYFSVPLMTPELIYTHAISSAAAAPAAVPVDIETATATALPIFIMASVFQNVVPMVAKNLNYQRHLILPALTLGASLPILMYLLFIGISNSTAGLTSNSELLSIFAAIATVSSTLGCTLSLATELTFEGGDTGFSMPSLSLAMIPPLAMSLSLLNGGDGSSAGLAFLRVGGSLSPVLYGLIPAFICSAQRKSASEDSDDSHTRLPIGGKIGLTSLGAASSVFFFDNLSHILF